MKKLNIENLAMVIPFFAIIFLTVLLICKIGEEKRHYEHLYPLSTIVYDVCEENDIVTIEDFNGNLWQFSGVEDWRKGDICAVIFDSKGTEEIKDDEIIKVRYSGD